MRATPETDKTQAKAEAFGEWLRTRMEASGYATTGDRPGGQKRLSDETQVSQSIISRALRGISIPTPDAAVQLGKALGAHPAEVLRAAGHGNLADLLDFTLTHRAQAAADPIAARIAHTPELSGEQRAWLTGFYERRRAAIAGEIDELIRFAGDAPKK